MWGWWGSPESLLEEEQLVYPALPSGPHQLGLDPELGTEPFCRAQPAHPAAYQSHHLTGRPAPRTCWCLFKNNKNSLSYDKSKLLYCRKLGKQRPTERIWVSSLHTPLPTPKATSVSSMGWVLADVILCAHLKTEQHGVSVSSDVLPQSNFNSCV